MKRRMLWLLFLPVIAFSLTACELDLDDDDELIDDRFPAAIHQIAPGE